MTLTQSVAQSTALAVYLDHHIEHAMGVPCLLPWSLSGAVFMLLLLSSLAMLL
jgi:hypothetical protein